MSLSSSLSPSLSLLSWCVASHMYMYTYMHVCLQQPVAPVTRSIATKGGSVRLEKKIVSETDGMVLLRRGQQGRGWARHGRPPRAKATVQLDSGLDEGALQ